MISEPTNDLVRHMVDSRWFRRAELLLALLAGALWYVAAGKLSWQPMLLALIPWLVRLRYARFPFQRTPFDPFLLLFLISAAVGVWSAYDQAAAWSKFWIIVGALFIFYAIAGQSRRDMWLAVGSIGSVGALYSGYFLLTHDWQAWPADIKILTQIGRRWQTMRPTISTPALHPNIAGGIMAALAPLLIATGHRGWRKRKPDLLALAMILSLLLLVGLILTSSRAAWLALTVASMLWLSWLASRSVATSLGFSRRCSFIFLLGIGAVFGLLLLFGYAGGLTGLLASLPGPDSTTSRLQLARDTWELIRDFPITGGGLAAFAGLYSNYIAVIPFFQFDYGHSFFLDVFLEQGVFAIASLVVILSASIWLLISTSASRRQSRSRRRYADTRGYRWAVFTGLLTMCLHGLMDDAFYGYLGTPMLFALPGLAVLVTKKRGSNQSKSEPSPIQKPAILAIIAVFAIIVWFGVGSNPVAAWYANLGAVQMAKTELEGWPTGKWDDGSRVDALNPATGLFQRALRTDPENRTAQHRLGLIAMLRRDFDQAVFHLEAAHARDKEHRGVLKALAYNYVWAGEADTAFAYLIDIPEARREIHAYVSWWRNLGREDLADNARQMRTRLNAAAGN